MSLHHIIKSNTQENFSLKISVLLQKMYLLTALKQIRRFHGEGLFNIADSQYSNTDTNCLTQLYPASTTKVMTAYLALKYGNLDDVVTMSATSTNFNWDESTCGLSAGDSLTLYDLICGLLLQSGNDCAAAIAEHISGSQEAFAELMNDRSKTTWSDRNSLCKSSRTS